MIVQKGSTDVKTYFILRTASDGTATTGATITDIDLQYCRSGAAPSAKVDATALAATDSAHADNKAIEIDATDQPGLYRVDWPDAAFAAGVDEVILTVKLADSFTEHLRVELSPAVDVVALDGGEQSATDLKDFADTGYDPSTHRAFSDLKAILATELTETSAGYLAAAFKKLFDVVTPLLVASDVMRGTNSAALATALGTPVALDSGTATIAGMLTKMADDNGGADFDAGEHSLEKLTTAIVAGFPTNEHADVEPGGGDVITGTNTAGDSDSTWLNDGTYWQIAGAAADGDGFGVRVDQVFTLGTDKKANLLRVNAKETLVGYVLPWAYNYVTATWDQLADAITAISGSADLDYMYTLLSEHQQTSDGEVQIRFTSTDTTTNKYLYLDQVQITVVAVSELTASEIANAVWETDVSLTRQDGGEFIAGHTIKRDIAIGTDVATENTTTSFTLAAGKTTANAYVGMLLEVRDESAATREIETRRITGWTSGRVVTVDRAFSFTPTVGDHVHIHNKYANVDLTAILGTAPTEGAAGRLAAALTKLLDVATPTGTINSLPDAVPGAAGGVFIAGTNAPVTITGSGNALTLTSTGGDGDGLAATGEGRGCGIDATGGAEGYGIEVIGGSTRGDAINASATDGDGMHLSGGTNGHGLNADGDGSGEGIAATGGATGHGIEARGGVTSGNGLYALAVNSGAGIQALGDGNNSGIVATGEGQGHGIDTTGGATGHGARIVGGANGNGLVCQGGTAIHANGENCGFMADADQAGSSGMEVDGVAFGLEITASAGPAMSCVAEGGDNSGIVATKAGSGYDIDADIHGTIDTASTVTDGALAAKLEAYVQLLARSDAAITADRATELAEINANEGSGAGDYAATTDSQEAIRDRGDAEWATATSVAVSDKTGFSLASDGMDSVTLPADIITAASINTGALTADAFAANALVAATFAASSLDGKGDWNTTVPDAAGVVATALGNLETHGDSTWATATSVTVSDKTGFKLASDGLAAVTAWTVNVTGTVSGNSTHDAAAVWDEAYAGHVNAGSFGILIGAAFEEV